MKSIAWFLFVFLATAIGLYPLLYLADPDFGFLSSKPDEVRTQPLWITGFYLHIGSGGIALLTGWSQFSGKIRKKYLRVHRTLGKIYVTAAVASAISGIYIAFFANGGWISALGFLCLGAIWLLSTVRAYGHIRKKQVALHQRAMTYSYAACFAAVTLRLWLPLLALLFGSFTIAYQVVAWWCWIPNMGVAWMMVRNIPAKAARA